MTEERLKKSGTFRRTLLHVPILCAAAIGAFYLGVDRGVFEFAQTETMYGVFVLLLLPLAGVLTLLQLALWWNFRAR